MYNIPISLKLQRAAKSGNLHVVVDLLTRYDFLIHPFPDAKPATDASAHVEMYELLTASYMMRKHNCCYFVEMTSERTKSKNASRLRRVVFIGPDADTAVDAFKATIQAVDSTYRRRLARHTVGKGSSSAMAYKVGHMEALIDRTPYLPCSDVVNVLQSVRIRGFFSRGRRDMKDKKSWGAGLDDGLVFDLAPLN